MRIGACKVEPPQAEQLRKNLPAGVILSEAKNLSSI